MRKEHLIPKRLVRYCGADCTTCDAYKRLLVGDEGGLVNPETKYRCCWLPDDYPEGRNCLIKTCCEEKGILFCGECSQFEKCGRMKEFYAKPGYNELRRRMIEEIARRKTECSES